LFIQNGLNPKQKGITFSTLLCLQLIIEMSDFMIEGGFFRGYGSSNAEEKFKL
jgi:hypothetical protein